MGESMSKFKVGDRVRRTGGENCGMNTGDLGTVTEEGRYGGEVVILRDGDSNSYWHDSRFLELIEAPKFEVGDKVSWCGVEGVVGEWYPNAAYPIKVDFYSDIQYFTSDGKFMKCHKEPSPLLIEKWKPLKKELDLPAGRNGIDLPEEFRGKKVRVTIEEVK
jgi:hypothetical protein